MEKHLSFSQARFTPNPCPPRFIITASLQRPLLCLVMAAGDTRSLQKDSKQCRGLGSGCQRWKRSFPALLLPSRAFPVLHRLQVSLGVYLLLMEHLLLLLLPEPWCSLIPFSLVVELARAGHAWVGAAPDLFSQRPPCSPLLPALFYGQPMVDYCPLF